MEQNEFLVVTDSSAGDTDMSFGWKICTTNGDPIAENAGLAFGQASSFYNEGYGVLSALSFFSCAMEYTASTTTLAFQLHLDNEGVIARIKKQQSYSNDFSFNMLAPDWNVIAPISNILDMGNILSTFKHTKGHQDKNRKYEDLSLTAKLNVDADPLAIEYWAPNTKTTRKAIRLPINAVQLYINGVT
eukprot:2655560-Ditylum_brightwellii.AAC.1